MADLKARIAKRCAKEFKDGDFANPGIGLPTMVADYIPEDILPFYIAAEIEEYTKKYAHLLYN